MSLTLKPESDMAVPSLAVATAQEKAALHELTRQERDWYSEHERFATDLDISRAAKVGTLAFVGVNRDIAPIARLRNRAKNLEFPPYLIPNSLNAYRAYGRMWRREIQEQGIDDDRLRLSATSFVRSEEKQAVIAKDPTKLAEAESTHCAGGPWDTDAWEYYWLDDEHGLMKVTTRQRDPETVEEIASMLGTTPTPVAPVPHNPEVVRAAIVVADRLHHAGLVNRILEFAGSPNQCLHMAPNPEVEAEEWQALARGEMTL